MCISIEDAIKVVMALPSKDCEMSMEFRDQFSRIIAERYGVRSKPQSSASTSSSSSPSSSTSSSSSSDAIPSVDANADSTQEVDTAGATAQDCQEVGDVQKEDCNMTLSDSDSEDEMDFVHKHRPMEVDPRFFDVLAQDPMLALATFFSNKRGFEHIANKAMEEFGYKYRRTAESDADVAILRAETEKIKAETEVVKIKAETEAVKIKAETEVAKIKAESDAEVAKIKAKGDVEIAKIEAEDGKNTNASFRGEVRKLKARFKDKPFYTAQDAKTQNILTVTKYLKDSTRRYFTYEDPYFQEFCMLLKHIFTKVHGKEKQEKRIGRMPHLPQLNLQMIYFNEDEPLFDLALKALGHPPPQ